MSPNQRRFDGFEKGLHRSIIITITFVAHGHLKAKKAHRLQTGRIR